MLIVAIAALLVCVKTKAAAFAFRCLCLCPILVTLLVTWLVTALLLFLAAASSDFCYDPASVLLNVANKSVGPGDNFDTIAFYITPCGSTPPRGAFKTVQVRVLAQVCARAFV
jgi:hypothetical protein